MTQDERRFAKSMMSTISAAEDLRIPHHQVYELIKARKLNSFKMGWNHIILKDSKFKLTKKEHATTNTNVGSKVQRGRKPRRS